MKPYARIAVWFPGRVREARVLKCLGTRLFWYHTVRVPPWAYTGTVDLRDEGDTWARWGTDAAKAMFVAAALEQQT